MDLVPHIPHLHGLDIQFLKMHIDQEPILNPALQLSQPNGFINGPPHIGKPALPYEQGLTNGHGHSQPSTYV